MAQDDRNDDVPRPEESPGVQNNEATPVEASTTPSGEEGESGRFKGLKKWARSNAPPLHTFLVSAEKPYPFLREAAVGVVILLLAATLLWGGTGQPLGKSPVVVIESGSMMHCDQGRDTISQECEGRFGRLGTIDPGDLVFVRDVDGKGDVTTFGMEARCDPTNFDDLSCKCAHDSFGACGDVIIYKPGGSSQATPIIHRALFWLEVHGDGTFSIPECGLERVPRLNLSNVCMANLGARGWNTSSYHHLDSLQPEDSGFITRGDNNGRPDLPSITPFPVQPDWILGKARGEVPWVGLVKLGVSDIAAGCKRDVRVSCNFDNAPPDVKTMMWVTIVVLVAAPFVVDKVQAFRHRDDEED